MTPKVIRDAFLDFTIPKEGRLGIMYPDTKNLVSTGVGNLIDPVGLALLLPWLRADGSRAGEQEIRDEFQRVKGQGCGDYRDAAHCAWEGSGKVCLPHRGWTETIKLTRLHLSEDAIDRLVFSKLDEMWDYMVTHDFPMLPNWPADAQLGMCSMSWALGPAFAKMYPRFLAASKAEDFLTMAEECRMEGKGTIIDRNRANKMHFMNASYVQEHGMDYGVLHFTPLAVSEVVDLSTREGVQRRLAALGFDPGPIDGRYGPMTKAAVQAFQRSKGLVPDGIVGPLTRQVLAPGH